MARALRIALGQHSDKGRKEANQDFHGALIPEAPVLGAKGIAIALADGISSSSVSHIAAETAIKSFLVDYYCTSDSWSVKTSAQRVIAATNSWLYAQTRRSQTPYDMDKGYVCTLSVMVLKSTTAHIFHLGDCRVYRVSGQSLEQLTQDHRVAVSPAETYLGRALGTKDDVEIDYRAVGIKRGDTFVLATDGVYEHVTPGFVVAAIVENGGELNDAARAIVAQATQNGSPDNLTVQVVRIDDVPEPDADEARDRATELPLPPPLQVQTVLDGYRIIRQIHASSRSHIYLAEDVETGGRVALKVPSVDLSGDANALKRLMMEDWIARRLDSPAVLKAAGSTRQRSALYVVTEYVEGQTLAQWMRDNPRPSLEAVRGLVEQIAAGLRAFHRLEMLHQDIRPENVLIDGSGTARIIDFGSTRVAGVLETTPGVDGEEVLGTVQYTAPEYFIGARTGPRSDLFSLGVMTYQMLTGHLPYGIRVAQSRTRALQRSLRYVSALTYDRRLPVWVDRTLMRAVDPDPAKRYEALSEFVYDLRHPRQDYLRDGPVPLLERNPLLFWKTVSAVLALVVIWLLATR